MCRWFSLAALFLALPFFIRADEPTETVISLSVQPMPAPKPALRYQLLPDLREMNPGNPVQEFMQCILDHKNLRTKEAAEQVEKWRKMPLKELPINELRKFAEEAVARAKYAARLDTPDWQVLLKLKKANNDLLDPNVAFMLNLGKVLSARLRGDIAESRFDSALDTLKTMLVLARISDEYPSFMGFQVSVAIGTMTPDPLDEMVQQPGCPNLFWALTSLPHPLLDHRKSWQGEKLFLFNTLFEGIDDTRPMNERQIGKIINQFQKFFSEKGEEKFVSEWVTQKAKDSKYVRLASQRLKDAGLAESTLQGLPPSQIILLDEKLANEIKLDEFNNACSLPYWQGVSVLAARKEDTIVSPFRIIPIPRNEATAVLEQRFALLRCVEAIRMHAADHDGQLPARLEEIKLPLPVDPITGQAFRYQLIGGIGHLRGTPPTVYSKQENRAYNIRYEITIRK